MEPTKLSALLLLAMLALSSSPLALAWEKAEPECNSCQGGGSPPSSGTPAGGGLPLPPITIPSAPLPSVPLPPVTGVVTPVVGLVPPVVGPVVGLVPPVVGGLPPISLPPIIGGGGSPKRGHGGRKACPPPPTPTPPTPTPSYDTCPIDALKLGACVDILGNEVYIGDANVKCCPLVKGIAGLSAAACLCTAIKAKVLDLSVYVPIALEVLLNCGCAVPPGYKCA